MNEADDMQIELHHAWSWTCPVCKTHSYVESVRAQVTDDEIRAELGYDQDDEITEAMREDFICAPDIVTCTKCDGSFMAKIRDVFPHVDEDDDYDGDEDDL